jgi:ATP-binding cassette subfamily B protein
MILVFSGVAFVLWSGGAEVIAGTLTPGVLSAFIFYAVVVAGSLGSFSEIYADLQRAAGAAERLEEMLTIQSALVEPRNPRLLPQPPRGVVALHNVTFSYPSQHDRPVLNNITLSVAPGEKLALVGTSGAGKSTILSLLMRFYSPQSGAIYIDGVDVREASIADVRSRIALVPQEPVIFSGTLYENILYGRPDATETEVWQAAEAAHLLGVIQSLPKGIHTPLGIKGIQLSGGQKQRVSIARAILKNPTILLLDEATNALDAESEKLVQDSLKPLIATRTTIIVAHRLATVLKADRIVVLDRGQIQSVGTHAELISEDGLYRRLATLQFTDSLELGRRSSRDTKVLWG